MGKDPRFGTVNIERRKYPRFSLDMPVEYWQAEETESYPSRTVNVSASGIILYFPEEIEIGKKLRLRLFSDSGLTLIPIDALAEVVWKGLSLGDKGAYRIGVRFIELSERDMANLKKCLNGLMEFGIKPELDIPPRLLSALGIKTSEYPLRSFPKKVNAS